MVEKRTLLGLIAVAALIASSGARGTPAHAISGKAVTSIHGALVVSSLSGTGKRPLTTSVGGSRDSLPTWSPDGSKVAFVRSTAQELALMVVDDDGSPPRRVAVVGGGIEDIRWSPDGKSLAYLAYFDQAPNERIYVASAAGSEQREVATLPSEPFGFFELFGWSRDGKRVTYAFLRGEPTEMRYEGPADLVTVASDGSERKTVLRAHEINDATWLSDGRLAYSRNCVDVPCQLTVFNPTSRHSTPLTHFKWPGSWGWDDLAFAQRPHSRDIVFTHGRTVYEVSPRTGKMRRLLNLRCPAKRCFPNDDGIALAGITGDGRFALLRHVNYSGDSVFMRAYRLDLNTRARRRIHLVTADPAEIFLP